MPPDAKETAITIGAIVIRYFPKPKKCDECWLGSK